MHSVSAVASAVRTVMVVEDEAAVRGLLGKWLAPASEHVVACGSFEEAREYLSSHTPDVLVTDIRLRAHNGLQLVAWLKDRLPAVTCVVLTGHDDPVLRRVAEQMHARYLVKPLGREDLLAAVGAS